MIKTDGGVIHSCYIDYGEIHIHFIGNHNWEGIHAVLEGVVDEPILQLETLGELVFLGV